MCAAALLLYPPIRQRGVFPDDVEQPAPAFERFGGSHEAEGGASLQERSRLAGVGEMGKTDWRKA